MIIAGGRAGRPFEADLERERDAPALLPDRVAAGDVLIMPHRIEADADQVERAAAAPAHRRRSPHDLDLLDREHLAALRADVAHAVEIGAGPAVERIAALAGPPW